MNSRTLVSSTVGLILAVLSCYANATLISFQNGTGGYTGTHDTELRADAPNTAHGAAPNFSVDGDDNGSTGNQPTHALMWFSSIIGNGAGQIAPNSTISSATLGLQIHSPGDDLTMWRMPTVWDESSATWNSVGGGITGAVFLRNLSNLDSGSVTDEVTIYLIDVAAELQLWANGTDNFGWGFTPTGNDGVDFHSSEHSIHNITVGNQLVAHVRPQLTVDFIAPKPPPQQAVPAPPTLALLLLGLIYLRRVNSATPKTLSPS